MIYRCKICAGSLKVEPNSRIAVCEYCGTKQVLPLFSDDSAKVLFDRGNNYLRHNEFDKAETLFNQLLSITPTEPEIYWNLVLCRYGVTFVCDPKTNKYIPTCNRTHFQSIFKDENYLNAIKYSDKAKKAFYKSNAETIDKIQHDVINISKHEKPFDIFISYKETDSNGNRSKDSVIAQNLYEKLTDEGYKVFFSRITLEDKIGSQYEPYIYSALYSSKVMITVSSSKENLESAWVKNEWSRFLSFAQSKGEKTLIPLYFEMDKEDLPSDFALFPSYNIQAEGTEQELIRGIKKLIPVTVTLKEKRRKRNRWLLGIGVAALIGIAIGGVYAYNYYQRMPEYNAAVQLYYDRNYAEASWAFEAMGDYRDSEEMKVKCQQSWRKSLATIAEEENLGGYTSGAYYVTPNGTVDTFNYNPGTAHSNVGISDHGKIVSITGNDPIYALHEDGFLDNVAVNNGFFSFGNDDSIYEQTYYDNLAEYSDFSEMSEWQDIIQISPVFHDTNVALRADGKLIYGKSNTDDWLVDVSSWEKIVSFDYYISGRILAGEMFDAVIAAVDSEGNVHIVSYNEGGEKIKGIEIVEAFENINKISISVIWDDNPNPDESDKCINAVALTKNGKILSFINGEYNEYDSNGIIAFDFFGYSLYELHSDGTLYKNGSDKYILPDVVYIKDGFVVTRSGNIYSDMGSTPTEGKTRVLDEWIERFN